MAISPDKARAALDHAVTKVMLRDKKSGVWKALQRDGVNTILDLVTMDPPNEFCGNWLESRESDRRSRIGDVYVRRACYITLSSRASGVIAEMSRRHGNITSFFID